MPEPAPPPIPIAESSPPTNARNMAIKAGIALTLALLFFVVGWFVGRGPVGELRERADSAESSLALMQDRLHVGDAASLLYRTALDLEARNFGTANDRLDEAAVMLDEIGAAGSGLDSLRQAVASTDLNVAEDLSGQRSMILGFAEALQELMPKEDESQMQEVRDVE